MAQREMKQRAWWIFLVVMAPIVGLYLFGPGALNSGPVFNAIGLTAVVAILVGVHGITSAARYLHPETRPAT